MFTASLLVQTAESYSKVCIVSVTSLNPEYLSQEDSSVTLQYGIQTQNAYAIKNNYSFFHFNPGVPWSRTIQQAARLEQAVSRTSRHSRACVRMAYRGVSL